MDEQDKQDIKPYCFVYYRICGGFIPFILFIHVMQVLSLALPVQFSESLQQM